MRFALIWSNFIFTYIFLLELIHQENQWLEKVQDKLNSSKVGADAEEISEEYDVRNLKNLLIFKNLKL